MALAIGLATINGATTYHAGNKVKELPPDPVALERQMRRGKGMYS